MSSSPKSTLEKTEVIVSSSAESTLEKTEIIVSSIPNPTLEITEVIVSSSPKHGCYAPRKYFDCLAFSVNFSNCQFGFHVLEYYLAVAVHLNTQLT